MQFGWMLGSVSGPRHGTKFVGKDQSCLLEGINLGKKHSDRQARCKTGTCGKYTQGRHIGGRMTSIVHTVSAGLDNRTGQPRGDHQKVHDHEGAFEVNQIDVEGKNLARGRL